MIENYDNEQGIYHFKGRFNNMFSFGFRSMEGKLVPLSDPNVVDREYILEYST